MTATATEATTMIKNEKQYRTTHTRVREFEAELARLEQAGPGKGVHPQMHRMQIDGVKSQIETMQAEIREYDDLRNGRRKVLRFATIGELPKALIQARIARGLTQQELADKLDLKRQQVSDYEDTDYQRASFARIVEVARALNLDIREEVRLP
jgi:DNA-binding XRE family transcriptional regulator